jgi:hypothetical protein
MYTTSDSGVDFAELLLGHWPLRTRLAFFGEKHFFVVHWGASSSRGTTRTCQRSPQLQIKLWNRHTSLIASSFEYIQYKLQKRRQLLNL